MKPVFALGLGVAALALIVGSMSAFTVSEMERVVVLQFGRPVNQINQAGLNFRIPLIQEVRYFDKRILGVDLAIDQVTLSADKNDPIIKNVDLAPALDEVPDENGSGKTGAAVNAPKADDSGGMPIKVEVFARYKIMDPLQFMQRFQNEDMATQRISYVMNGAVRDVLGTITLRTMLSIKRDEVMQNIKAKVNMAMAGRGIEIVDIRIVRADLTDRLLASTVSRMKTENAERAQKTRSEGDRRAKEIRAQADREKTVLLAEAQKDSQILRGEGDAEAIKTYNEAYNKDKDFYAFTRTLEAYRNSLATPDTRLILSPDGQFLRYIDKP
jgi:membrane protease subunit HflC